MMRNNLCVGFVGIRVSTFVLLSAIMVLLLSAIACSSSGTDDSAVYGDTKPIVYDTTSINIVLEVEASVSIAITKDNRGDFSPKTTSLSIAPKAGNPNDGITAKVDNNTGEITFSIADASDISSGAVYSFTLTYTDNNYKDYTIDFSVIPISSNISGYSLSYKAKGSIGIALDAKPIWDATPTATYEITPELPAELGLTFDPETGNITGTPKTGYGGLYTVSATATSPNSGTKKAKVFITVFIDPIVVSTPTESIAIGTRAELMAIGTDATSLAGTYHLTADIDLDDPEAGDANWEPLGSEASPFTGTLHGNGHAIYNLKIAGVSEDSDAGNYQGLFAKIDGSTAKVENLGIGVSSIKGNAAIGALAGIVTSASATNIAAVAMSAPSADAPTQEASGAVDISGYVGSFVGGLVGSIESGTVSGYATGAVTSTGNDYVGGLVGLVFQGTVSGYATGAVTGSYEVGGLVGLVFQGTVSGYATGAVTGSYDVGGLVGHSAGTVSGYATGAVKGSNDNVGGLVGSIENDNVGGLVGSIESGTVSGYATGAVTGSAWVGGLVGDVTGGTVRGYATGAVSGGSVVGGLVGINSGTVSGYAMGAVAGSGHNVGGLVGMNYGTLSGYATGAVSGTANSVGGLVGINSGTVSGYATGALTGSAWVGGLVGSNSGTVSGYWDQASTKQSSSSGGGTGISATKNIALDSTTYTDSGATDPSAAIFNDARFLTVFELPGTAKTWPKLKASYTFNSKAVSFDWSKLDYLEWKQPTVSDTNGDGKIEVIVN